MSILALGYVMSRAPAPPWPADLASISRCVRPRSPPDVFASPAAAERAWEGGPPGELFGYGVYEDVARDLLDRGEPSDELEILAQGAVLAAGEDLGFELLDYDHGITHSWRCIGAEGKLAELMPFTLGPRGLIVTEDDARALLRHLRGPEVAKEDGLWLFAQIRRYACMEGRREHG